MIIRATFTVTFMIVSPSSPLSPSTKLRASCEIFTTICLSVCLSVCLEYCLMNSLLQIRECYLTKRQKTTPEECFKRWTSTSSYFSSTLEWETESNRLEKLKIQLVDGSFIVEEKLLENVYFRFSFTAKARHLADRIALRKAYSMD